MAIGGWSEYSEIVFSREWQPEVAEPEIDTTVMDWLEAYD